MGLTIHANLSTGARCDERRARAIIRALHRTATRFACAGRVEAVGPVIADVTALRHAERYLSIQRESKQLDGTMITLCDWLPALAGWGFRVDVGAGCEALWLGLCRYHAGTVVDGRQWIDTGLGRGWHYSLFCKTQFASLHGEEHFLRCHRAVIDLLLAARDQGVTVKINDEGDYWPGRREAALLKHVNFLSAAIAGMAGAFKDAADDAGGPAVQSPIFAHPQFERLEAEGVAKNGPHIRGAVAAARQLGKRR